jgi:hypothetical protein
MFTNIQAHERTDDEVDCIHMFTVNTRIIPSQVETVVYCKQTLKSKICFAWPQNFK